MINTSIKDSATVEPRLTQVLKLSGWIAAETANDCVLCAEAFIFSALPAGGCHHVRELNGLTISLALEPVPVRISIWYAEHRNRAFMTANFGVRAAISALTYTRLKANSRSNFTPNRSRYSVLPLSVGTGLRFQPYLTGIWIVLFAKQCVCLIAEIAQVFKLEVDEYGAVGLDFCTAYVCFRVRGSQCETIISVLNLEGVG